MKDLKKEKHYTLDNFMCDEDLEEIQIMIQKWGEGVTMAEIMDWIEQKLKEAELKGRREYAKDHGLYPAYLINKDGTFKLKKVGK